MEKQKKQEPAATEIRIIYDDGTERSLEKGFVMEETSRSGETATIGAIFLRIKPADLYLITEALYVAANELGLLKKGAGEHDD